ncbi:DUF1648 domain-containing protein [Robertkochia flava]|uniref:DUF1648 domain-containing protein n=1 Tax=Robertkochia flava TaxID=3447986 RepID=UPI001CCD2FB5|nr:DUF1648 domain-containing protein [Robertkochia marina]
MPVKPKIKPELKLTDKLIELSSLILLFGMWVYILINYQELPDKIPTHYNFHGEADAFGSKNSIFIIPVIATFLYLGLFLLNRFPHILNYPKKITPDNARKQYALMTRMIRVLNLIILATFLIIAIKTINYTEENSKGFGSWLMILILITPLLPIIYYNLKSIKEK